MIKYIWVFYMNTPSEMTVSLSGDMWTVDDAIVMDFAGCCCLDMSGSIDYAARMAEDLKKQGGWDGCVPLAYFLKISGSYLRRITLRELHCNGENGFDYWRTFAVLMECLIDSMADLLGNNKATMLQSAKQMYPQAEWSDNYHPPWEQ